MLWSFVAVVHRSIARSLGCSLASAWLVARSLALLLACSVARSLSCSVGRSFSQSVGRLVVRSLACSLARLLVRSLDRRIGAKPLLDQVPEQLPNSPQQTQPQPGREGAGLALGLALVQPLSAKPGPEPVLAAFLEQCSPNLGEQWLEEGCQDRPRVKFSTQVLNQC